MSAHRGFLSRCISGVKSLPMLYSGSAFMGEELLSTPHPSPVALTSPLLSLKLQQAKLSPFKGGIRKLSPLSTFQPFQLFQPSSTFVFFLPCRPAPSFGRRRLARRRGAKFALWANFLRSALSFVLRFPIFDTVFRFVLKTSHYVSKDICQCRYRYRCRDSYN